MINLSPARKNKIVLTDYDYKRDIENRILMSTFSVVDVEVLEEVLNSSLIIPISKLARDLSIELADLIPIIDKLSATGLLQRHHDVIVVDKEMRKYYESQLPKFDEEFECGMDFLQSLLKKVPIHVLPVWYSVPRTSTNIFQSLVEKYLQTPRLFQRYLLELNFGDPVLNGIMNDVFTAPDFKVLASNIREKYSLTRSDFEEYLLHLEFNFICCVSHVKIADQWKEVVTPFHEWRDFLRFKHDNQPTPIKPSLSIQRKRPADGAFASDFKVVLKRMISRPLALGAGKKGAPPHLAKNELIACASQCTAIPPITDDNIQEWQDYFNWIAAKLIDIELAKASNNQLTALPEAKEWAAMDSEELGLSLYRHPQNGFVTFSIEPSLLTEKNFREMEKTLERCGRDEWIFLDDFLNGVISLIGNTQEISLHKKGRRWEYLLPTYSEEEKTFMRATVMERFFEAGFISIGICQRKECFTVTPYGRNALGLP